MAVDEAHPRGDDARVRSARTKHTRTRAALIAAAVTAFNVQGWAASRMEDIATQAGVSSATAYNHFPTKHVLIGVVFAPHVTPLLLQADRGAASGRPVVEALSDQIDALAQLSSHQRALTAAFTAAVLEYTIRTERTPDPDDELDPRVLVPLVEQLRRLTRYGQRTWQLREDPSAQEISSSLVNLLLVRSLNHKSEPARVTAELLRTLLLRTMTPPGEPHRMRRRPPEGRGHVGAVSCRVASSNVV